MFEATEMKLATSLCSQEAFVKKKKKKNSSLMSDTENWMLEIPPWTPTRRVEVFGRVIKVRML